MAKKVKIIRQYGDFRKSKTYEVTDNVAQFLMENSIASLVEVVEKKTPCPDGDCEDCEDCKSKKKKRTPKKATKKTIDKVG